MTIVLIVVAVVVVGGAIIYYECKKAPEMWCCKECGTEVMGFDFCPYCRANKS